MRWRGIIRLKLPSTPQLNSSYHAPSTRDSWFTRFGSRRPASARPFLTRYGQPRQHLAAGGCCRRNTCCGCFSDGQFSPKSNVEQDPRSGLFLCLDTDMNMRRDIYCRCHNIPARLFGREADGKHRTKTRLSAVGARPDMIRLICSVRWDMKALAGRLLGWTHELSVAVSCLPNCM